MTNQRTIFRNAQLADGHVVDIAVVGGNIEAIGATLDLQGTDINCEGLIALQGLVDLHTHLREPGFEQSETILTGSRAAAKGGFTAVHAMANTSPVADSAAVVEQVFALGQAAGYVHVQPIGAVTSNLEGKQLADLLKMNQSRAGVTVFSDDGKCVSDSLLMRRALEYVKAFGGVIAQHAQDPNLTVNAQMNEGALSFELGLTGWPQVAEEAIIARDVLLAEHVGSRLHICHVSTAGSVEIIRWAKARGIEVTAEVTPHHLILTEDLVKDYNPIFKVNPPLRTEKDVLALRAAVADGTIDIVATDHAPHTADSKDCEFGQAAFGMIGLETAAAVVQTTLIETGLINWTRFQEILSTAPAAISGLSRHGQQLAAGNAANLTFIDPTARVIVGPESESKSRNNPYLGLELNGQIVHTMFEGTFTVKNNQIQEIHND
ncbi:MAG: dihydroorotase [Micrococcales bacterium]|nr:dihydroorotase [Microbacteriaceae bacterium]NBR22616.1 dihydroorotase [Micrococcales bacterium]NBX94147.1 dihydroorotase [Actinomycetota bacterium]NBR77469.1 dihydroorotase [Microbacteriaceae bacterium]NBS60504.1 dihydroorotase [Microbacteriaceae bacterium]